MYLLLGGGVLLLLLLFFLAGPRVEVDTTIRPLTLPEDLDRYLAEQEALYNDLVPGTEKIIRWAGEPGQKTPLSVIYLHGFSATRQESAPLADRVAAALGANLFYTRFTGHGRTSEAMLECTVNAYVNDIAEAMAIGRRIGERVVVMGLSTGAAAATWLAVQPMARHAAAFILISPNYALADKRSVLLTLPWGGLIGELVNGPEYSWKPQGELHRTYWTYRFPTRALLPMIAFIRLVRSLPLETIHQPVLTIYSPYDRVIDPRAIPATFARIGAADKLLVPIADTEAPERHVLAGDILAPNCTSTIAAIILDFLHSAFSGTGGAGSHH